MTGIDWLRLNLQRVLALPAPAIEWLLMLYGAIQVFDDVADGDAVERDDLNAAIWNTLVGMSQNTFWIANSQTLTPIVASMILKWQASDQAERSGKFAGHARCFFLAGDAHAARCALDDSFVKQPPGSGRRKKADCLCGTAGLAEDGDVVRIATERRCVVAHPLQGHDEIEHPRIAGIGEPLIGLMQR